MKKIILCSAVFLAAMQMNAQLTVDLTTGKDNSTGTQLACGAYEDSWQLLSGTNYIWPIVTDGLNPYSQQVWATPYSNNGKWITSTGSCVLPFLPQQGGAYEYKLTFYNNAGCGLTNVHFDLHAIGADNTIFFEFNNNTSAQYQVSTNLSNCNFNVDNYSTLNTTGITIPVNAGDIVPGLNELRAYVCNNDRNSGIYIYGELKADYLPDPNLIPSITSASTFCGGSPIIVSGSSATTTVNWHYWEMAECNSSGVVTPGGYLWSGFYGGAPTANFSIPNSATAPCGKYYKIKLALNNNCSPWIETNKVIFVACPASPVITGPSSLCYGQSGTYSIGSWPRGTSIQWSTGATNVTSINYSPTASTTLSVTVTGINGCPGTATFPINVYNTNPDFIPTTTLYGSYYTCSATPVVTTGLPPGFGYAWIAEEVTGPPTYASVPNTLVNNPAIGCWWTMTCNFTGYNGTSTYPSSCPPGNPPGQFTSGHYYRITRGTWSTNCGWQQISKVIFMCNNCRGGSDVMVENDNNAPSYEYLYKEQLAGNSSLDFNILPNPNNGDFSIQPDNIITDGTVEIYNLTGEKVEERAITGSGPIYISGAGLSKGIYLVRITSGEMTMSKKMIIE
jgi:hypothetical protein